MSAESDGSGPVSTSAARQAELMRQAIERAARDQAFRMWAQQRAKLGPVAIEAAEAQRRQQLLRTLAAPVVIPSPVAERPKPRLVFRRDPDAARVQLKIAPAKLAQLHGYGPRGAANC
jgi:hypothetical protein